MIASSCEGDPTLKETESPEEFAAGLREVGAWNRASGYCPTRIDPETANDGRVRTCEPKSAHQSKHSFFRLIAAALGITRIGASGGQPQACLAFWTNGGPDER